MFIVPSIAIALDIKDVPPPIPLVVPIEQPMLEDQFVYAQDLDLIAKSTLYPCNCVALVKKITGFKQSIGLAKNWPVNAPSPSIGSVVITNESIMGHVGIVKDIKDGKIQIYESNYVHCHITTTRWLPINSPLIIGFWSRRFTIRSIQIDSSSYSTVNNATSSVEDPR